MVLFQVLKKILGKKNWSKSILSKRKIGFKEYWAHQMFGPKKFGSEIIGLKKVRCSRTNAITGKAAIFIIAAR